MLFDKLSIHLSKCFKNQNVIKISGIWEELLVRMPVNFSASASQTNLLRYCVWDGSQDSGTGAWSCGGKSRGVDGNLQEQLPKDSDFHRRNLGTMQVRSLHNSFFCWLFGQASMTHHIITLKRQCHVKEMTLFVTVELWTPEPSKNIR